MSRRASHRSGQLTLRLLPGVSLLLLTLLTMTDLPIPLVDMTNPAFPIMAIFYFTLWQPRFLPHYVVFLCGLFYDAFQTSLLGTYALLFLAFRLGVGRLRQRTGFVERMLPNWGVFASFACLFFVVEWVVISIQVGGDILSGTVIERNLLTILLYPLLHYLFSFIIASLQSRSL